MHGGGGHSAHQTEVTREWHEVTAAFRLASGNTRLLLRVPGGQLLLWLPPMTVWIGSRQGLGEMAKAAVGAAAGLSHAQRLALHSVPEEPGVDTFGSVMIRFRVKAPTPEAAVTKLSTQLAAQAAVARGGGQRRQHPQPVDIHASLIVRRLPVELRSKRAELFPAHVAFHAGTMQLLELAGWGISQPPHSEGAQQVEEALAGWVGGRRGKGPNNRAGRW